MKNSKFVLGLSMALAVTALVACGDDSSSASTVVDPILVEPADDSTKSSSSANAVTDSSKDLNEVNCFEIGKNTVTTPVRCDNGLYFEKKSEFISFAEQEREKNKLFAYNCSEIATLCYDFLDSDGNMNGGCVPDIMCPADDSTVFSSSSVLMNSSSSSINFIPDPDCIVLVPDSVPGSSSSVIIPSCGTAVYTEKCIDTEFEGEVCDAIGCGALDCFENQKGWHALSCNGGSVMICDGTRWQYTNCVLPIIGSSSSSVENASSSSAYDPAGANGKPCETESEERYVGPYVYVCKGGQLSFLKGPDGWSGECDGSLDCGSSEYPEGWQNEPCSTEDEVRLDETFEYRCVGGKWSIQGYNPNLVDPNAERCRSSEIEGSACDVSGDLSHMSVNGCEFFCYGGKWEYTPPPM